MFVVWEASIELGIDCDVGPFLVLDRSYALEREILSWSGLT